MNCHPVATIRVEEAEDGKTILCQWYNASYETRMVDGKLTPVDLRERQRRPGEGSRWLEDLALLHRH